MGLTWWWYKARQFSLDGTTYEVRTRAKTDGLSSELIANGKTLATDITPISGPESTRNHHLRITLPDGRALDVEMGYITVWTVGIVARVDGALVHESHPGQEIKFPDKYKAQSEVDWRKQGAFAPHNRIPLGVDIATGLLFFAVAKMTDLTTAALVGAAVGIGLVVFQRITKIDVTGGLALFGIVMLLISAGLALAFQSDDMVKMRTTIVGCIAAALFLTDGLLGGKRLAGALARYLPYDDIDPGRLGIGMGVMGLVMAGLNLAVARLASTDVWLFYTTFLDFVLVVILIQFVFTFARSGRKPSL